MNRADGILPLTLGAKDTVLGLDPPGRLPRALRILDAGCGTRARHFSACLSGLPFAPGFTRRGRAPQSLS